MKILNPAPPWGPPRSDHVVLWHGCTAFDKDAIEKNGIDLTCCAADTDFGRRLLHDHPGTPSSTMGVEPLLQMAKGQSKDKGKSPGGIAFSREAVFREQHVIGLRSRTG